MIIKIKFNMYHVFMTLFFNGLRFTFIRVMYLTNAFNNIRKYRGKFFVLMMMCLKIIH